MTVVLGGGISGLSAAYYALKNPKIGPITVLEASNRLGGWIRSYELSNGIIFEKGPRTIRCLGSAGKNTLNLLEDLQLTNKLIPIKSDHPSAKNRMIYSRNKLHLLPNSFLSIFKTNSLLNRSLASFLIKDLTAPMVRKDDESIHSFITRRIGKDIADYLVSPMICGICAGDAQKISVNFLMKSLFEAEQKHGSIIKGLFKELFKMQDVNNMTEYKSNLVKKANVEKWVVWGLKGGLEELPRSLGNNLQTQGVDIQLNSHCEKLFFQSDHVELTINGKAKKYSHVISSLPAKILAKLLEEQYPDLAEQLKAIPMVTVAVVNLQFADNVLPINAFGFLVPPGENLPILGVIFDSCIFPKNSSTVLTVMMGGAWFEKYFGKDPSDEDLLNIAIKQVKEILNIKKEPIAFNVAILKDCIPQHVVGHAQRLNHIHDYISSRSIPLALCGSSYQGVGINDVILSAKEAVSKIVKHLNELKN
ncbi:protoporphyrinogen oxidase-like isoform X1 [Vespa mandarinia]|uniref:protoporphyrinogen oxidase-like isoform X1 n=1 Tax=Vespa mandarinia TaxID=7446 RepID=UPI00161DCADC|nr:protoporphyrinogen oxidase-like isoform X1 [Vespa mandarinia]XP_035730861.1 protoporphyrinogen oxidase-like isoform X1 [Vespa mandarinia]